MPAYREAHVVAFYVPFRGEVDLSLLLKDAIRSGKKVLLPRVLSKGNLAFVPYDGKETLVEDRYGIPEPAGREAAEPIDVMFVPCVGRHGSFRLGYGGEYYNNYLRSHAVRKTVGVLYAENRIDVDFHTDRDIPLDLFAEA